MQPTRLYTGLRTAATWAGPRRSILLLISLIGVCSLWFHAAPSPLQGQTVEPEPSATPAPNRAGQTARAEISPYLEAELAAGEKPVSFLVILEQQPDYARLAVEARQAANAAAAGEAPSLSAVRRAARGRYLYNTLTRTATDSQADLRAWLDARDVPYRAFYLINMLRVEGDAALATDLRGRPEVARLVANPEVAARHVPAMPAASHHPAAPARWPAEIPDSTSYGLQVTHTPEMWAMGYEGQGVVVAGQDTGVQWDHPALRAVYRGWDGQRAQHAYNWLDAWAGQDTMTSCAGLVAPCDDNGHGTHTMGSVVGSTPETVYGVAPAAEWMGCRNMLQGVGTPDSYTACFEFFLAPYPPGGDPFWDGRPDLAPHVINNSWGCPPREGCEPDTLRMVVEAMEAAGQLVVASAGNSGLGNTEASCSTLDDPIGIYDAVLSVGAHDNRGLLASFSSRGPVQIDGSGRLKPDITAPGVGIRGPGRFSSYITLSGTSMAAPHVAGAAAVLWSAAPYLIGEPALTKQILLKSASPVRTNLCSGQATPVSPNPSFGYGRLNVAEAVRMGRTPWVLNVEVTHGDSLPLAGAGVTWRDQRTGYTHTVTTNPMGSVQLEWVFAGEYTLHATADGAETEPPSTGTVAAQVVVPDSPIEPVQGEAANDGLTLRYTIHHDRRLPNFYRAFFPTLHLSP